MPGPQQWGTVQGAWKGIPVTSWTSRELPYGPFAEHGLKPVDTWDDLLKAGSVLKAKGYPVGTLRSTSAATTPTTPGTRCCGVRRLVGRQGRHDRSRSTRARRSRRSGSNRAYRTAMTRRGPLSTTRNNRFLASGRALDPPTRSARSARSRRTPPRWPEARRLEHAGGAEAGSRGRANILGIMRWSTSQAAARPFVADSFGSHLEGVRASEGYNQPTLQQFRKKPMAVLGEDPRLTLLQDFAETARPHRLPRATHPGRGRGRGELDRPADGGTGGGRRERRRGSELGHAEDPGDLRQAQVRRCRARHGRPGSAGRPGPLPAGPPGRPPAGRGRRPRRGDADRRPGGGSPPCRSSTTWPGSSARSTPRRHRSARRTPWPRPGSPNRPPRSAGAGAVVPWCRGVRARRPGDRFARSAAAGPLRVVVARGRAVAERGEPSTSGPPPAPCRACRRLRGREVADVGVLAGPVPDDRGWRVARHADAPRRAVGLASLHALGDAGVVVVLGLAALAFGAVLPGWVDPVMERLVGVTLVGLGLWVVYALARSWRPGAEFRLRSLCMLVLHGLGRGWAWAQYAVARPPPRRAVPPPPRRPSRPVRAGDGLRDGSRPRHRGGDGDAGAAARRRGRGG